MKINKCNRIGFNSTFLECNKMGSVGVRLNIISSKELERKNCSKIIKDKLSVRSFAGYVAGLLKRIRLLIIRSYG